VRAHWGARLLKAEGSVVLGEALELVVVFIVIMANLALLVMIQRWSGLT
jgi:hypothetical protein